jgi:predicted alpha-1,6-mannanase (GH76 family)
MTSIVKDRTIKSVAEAAGISPEQALKGARARGFDLGESKRYFDDLIFVALKTPDNGVSVYGKDMRPVVHSMFEPGSVKIVNGQVQFRFRKAAPKAAKESAQVETLY